MRMLCQGEAPEPSKTNVVRDAMRKFLDESAWDRVFTEAWAKVITKFARFDEEVYINGRECGKEYRVSGGSCIAAHRFRTPL
jgi:hypothetical protein